jgi:hypothetical protein
MRGGFSFCGIDIADIGLEYAPENKDTYVYAPAIGNVHEETFEGHDGGYYYGASKEPKTFTLRCFYEDEHIAKGLMAKVFDLFRIGKKGLLVFKRRPWCYYYATVTEKPNIEDMHSYLNGLITITMKAYYPYARGLEVNGHLFYNLRTDLYHDEIMENTALFEYDYMVPNMSFTNIQEDKSIILYNPGTERAKVDIVISGQAGDGVIIGNNTTKQSCRYVAFTDSDGEIYTDGINGKTISKTLIEEKISFLYHDYGFIELEPAFPIIRDLYITCRGSTVYVTNILYEEESEKEWYHGKYIFVGNDNTGEWKKINRCIDKHTIELTSEGQNCSCKTPVVLMNEIQITLSQGTNINKLSFIYKPTYA